MKIPIRFAGCVIALLIATIATPSARAEWDDGYWLLDFSDRQKTGETGTNAVSQAVGLILLDGDSGVVLVETNRSQHVAHMSSRELLALLEAIQEAGFEVVALSAEDDWERVWFVDIPGY